MKASLISILIIMIVFLGCVNENSNTSELQSKKIPNNTTKIKKEKATQQINIIEKNNNYKQLTDILFPNSFWYEKIENTEYDEREEKIKKLFNFAIEQGHQVVLATKDWTTPVYIVNNSIDRVDVPLLAEWTPKEDMKLKEVPIPEGAIEDTARESYGNEEDLLGDGSITIIDLTNMVEYDLWQARQIDNYGNRVFSKEDRKNAKWVASWGNVISLNSNGIFECGLSARGSGAAYLAGMIWPEELEKGKINHKIIFSFPYNSIEYIAEPFTESDGYLTEEEINNIYYENTGKKDDLFPLPEGAIIQLDPSIDLENFLVTDPNTGEKRKLNKYEKAIARAMQEYGAVNIDNSGEGIQIYAVNSISYKKNPYYFLSIDEEGYYHIPKELFENIRIIKMNLKNNKQESSLTKQGWMNYLCGNSKCKTHELKTCKE